MNEKSKVLLKYKKLRRVNTQLIERIRQLEDFVDALQQENFGILDLLVAETEEV